MKEKAKKIIGRTPDGWPVSEDVSGSQQSRVAVRYRCPCCNEPLKLVLDVDMTLRDVVALKLHEPEPKAKAKPEWTPEQVAERNVLARAESSGILKAFEEAVESRANGQTPGHIPSYFLHYLRTMTPRLIPQRILDVLLEAYPDAFITVFASQGVACVVVEGVIRLFIPVEKLLGLSLRKLGRSSSVGVTQPRMDVDESEIRNWIKTRRGYVPAGSTEFLSALRQPTMGSYDALSLSGE
jgi:hypothetical protein